MGAINTLLIISYSFLLSCSNNNDASKDNAFDKASPSEAVQSESTSSNNAVGNNPTQTGGIVGEWQLKLLTSDENRNGKLDEEERKNALAKGQMKDYLKLNSDGSAIFYQHKLNGRYELKTESDGRKKLVLYDKDNNDENRGIVHTVSSNELILFKAGSTFTVYKRL